MIARLREVAGNDAVRDANTSDAVHGVLPRAVVAPADAAACAAVLAECSTNGWNVEVAGARTARDSGRPSSTVDVMLSTERMRGVTEYEPDDLTVGVAAGTSLAELRARVGEHRQRVPLDPADARASVGGVLARGTAGPMRRGWSTPRRQVLGLEVVTGDGRVLRVGGRVVKNVAGYDLNKLFVGSMGTLGVIANAHLRLLPAPQVAVSRVVRSDEVAVLDEVARALLALPMQPAAIELIGRPWQLVIRYEGGREAVDAAVAELDAVAADVDASTADDHQALEQLAQREAAAAVVLRIGVLPDRIPGVLTWMETLGVDGMIAAHAGDGIARLLMSGQEAERITPDRFAGLVDAARRELRGTVIVERAPAALMRAVDPWGPIEPAIARLTLELKRQFDPAGILQRGRWIA